MTGPIWFKWRLFTVARGLWQELRQTAVTKLFWLKLKSQRYLFLLLLVVVGLQLVMGQTSSYVLADHEPPLGIAVQQKSDDPLSHELVENLTNAPSLEIIIVDNRLSPEEVFKQVRVQGLIIIPSGYELNIEQGIRSPVQLIPAPGITDRNFAREQVANVIMQLRARYDLVFALGNLGMVYDFEARASETDLLEVVYEGPAFQSSPLEAKPVYGVSALLILIAFLHSALTVPTREDKRVIMRGKTAFLQQFCVSLVMVWLVWLVLITLYFVLMTVLVGALFDIWTCLGFIAIMLYVSLLAALLAQFIGKHAASCVFLPLFLLNMTLGGGLWENVSVTSLLSPLVPVVAVVAPGEATAVGTAILFGAAALILVALVLFISMFQFARNDLNRRAVSPGLSR